MSVSAAAVARIIRDYDVTFRLGYDDALAFEWTRARWGRDFDDDDRQLAYNLGRAVAAGLSPAERERLRDMAAAEKARLADRKAAEYAAAMAA